MWNLILTNVLKLVFYPVWAILKKQAFTQLNQVIDQLQEKYLENTNTIEEKLLNSSVYGNYNLVDNSTVKSVIQEAQNNFNAGITLDAQGRPSASAGLNIKF